MGDVGSSAGQAVDPDVTRWREAVHLERRAHARKRFAEVEGRFSALPRLGKGRHTCWDATS